MLIQQKSGNLNSSPTNKTIDYLSLEWYETNKRILHKFTQSGKEVTLRFLKENQKLTQGDIIYQDNESIIAIDVVPCEAIIIHPDNMYEMAAICYEIGNKHLPLFFENDELLVPFEMPLFNLLNAAYLVNNDSRHTLHFHSSVITFSFVSHQNIDLCDKKQY